MKWVLSAIVAISVFGAPLAAKERTWWEVWQAARRGETVMPAELKKAKDEQFWDFYGNIKAVCFLALKYKAPDRLSLELARSWIAGLETAWGDPSVPKTIDDLVTRNPGWSFLPLDYWKRLRQLAVAEGCEAVLPPAR